MLNSTYRDDDKRRGEGSPSSPVRDEEEGEEGMKARRLEDNIGMVESIEERRGGIDEERGREGE